MKRLVWATLLSAPLLLLATPAHAQQDPQGSLYFGYSYFRVDLPGAQEDDTHGLEADYTYFLQRRIGFVVSGSIHWGTLPAPTNPFQVRLADTRQISVLAGPHFVLGRGLTWEAGLRLLAGATNRRLDSDAGGIKLLDQWKFTAASTLLLEFRLADKIRVRVPQATVLFYNWEPDWTADWRIGAGIVIRGGEILQ